MPDTKGGTGPTEIFTLSPCATLRWRSDGGEWEEGWHAQLITPITFTSTLRREGEEGRRRRRRKVTGVEVTRAKYRCEGDPVICQQSLHVTLMTLWFLLLQLRAMWNRYCIRVQFIKISEKALLNGTAFFFFFFLCNMATVLNISGVSQMLSYSNNTNKNNSSNNMLHKTGNMRSNESEECLLKFSLLHTSVFWSASFCWSHTQQMLVVSRYFLF